MVERDTSSHGRKGASASTQVDKQTRKASSNEKTHGTNQRRDLENDGFVVHHPDKQPEVCIRQCYQRRLQIQRESVFLSHTYHILNRKHNHIHAALVSTQLRNMSPSVRRLMPGLSLCLVAAQLLCLMKAFLRLDPLPQV